MLSNDKLPVPAISISLAGSGIIKLYPTQTLETAPPENYGTPFHPDIVTYKQQALGS